jgi:hypothetical protein
MRVFRLGSLVVTPDAAYFVIAKELRHSLPWQCSEVQDEYHTQPVDEFVCEVCQASVPQRIAAYRQQMREIEQSK